MNAVVLKYAIEGSVLQSVTVPNFNGALLLFRLRKGSQVYYMSIEQDDVHSETYLADGLEDFKSLVGSRIKSFEIESGELEMDDGRNMGWTYYKFQGEKDSATLRFNSYTDEFYSVDVVMKCDKIETDKL